MLAARSMSSGVVGEGNVIDKILRGLIVLAEITFVDNAAIAELNNQYRNKPMPTDVLSFPLGKHCRGGALFCEWYVVGRPVLWPPQLRPPLQGVGVPDDPGTLRQRKRARRHEGMPPYGPPYRNL